MLAYICSGHESTHDGANPEKVVFPLLVAYFPILPKANQSFEPLVFHVGGQVFKSLNIDFQGLGLREHVGSWDDI